MQEALRKLNNLEVEQKEKANNKDDFDFLLSVARGALPSSLSSTTSTSAMIDVFKRKEKKDFKSLFPNQYGLEDLFNRLISYINLEIKLKNEEINRRNQKNKDSNAKLNINLPLETILPLFECLLSSEALEEKTQSNAMEFENFKEKFDEVCKQINTHFANNNKLTICKKIIELYENIVFGPSSEENLPLLEELDAENEEVEKLLSTITDLQGDLLLIRNPEMYSVELNDNVDSVDSMKKSENKKTLGEVQNSLKAIDERFQDIFKNHWKSKMIYDSLNLKRLCEKSEYSLYFNEKNELIEKFNKQWINILNIKEKLEKIKKDIAPMTSNHENTGQSLGSNLSNLPGNIVKGVGGLTRQASGVMEEITNRLARGASGFLGGVLPPSPLSSSSKSSTSNPSPT